MRMVVFDVSGYMAHFRRFYSSVTPLTYHFPPRNTVMGILACILGFDKDSYYEVFSRDKCRIAVALRTPVRRVMLPTNYLDTDEIKKVEKLRGLTNRVPTRMEYLLAVPPLENVSYRIFVTHEDQSLLNQLADRLADRRFAYPISLGPAHCLAEANLVYDSEAKVIESNGDEYPVSTVIPQDIIEDIIVDGPAPVKGIKIMLEEKLPPDFKDGRMPAGASRNYVFEASGIRLRVKIRGEVFAVETVEGMVYGVFM
jgi:CRISPR-associated protein Cas5h